MLNISQKAKNALLAPSRYIKFKIEVYFDGEDNPPTDITHDVISFDTVEEVSPSTTLPFGGVSYNELSVVLDNMQQLYTISNTSSMYNGKLIANKKVKLTYLVETDEDVFEEITGGVFYTDAWSSDNEALTAALTCYDKLALYGNTPVSRFRVAKNISFKNAYIKLFVGAGLSSDDYIIDDTLNGTLEYFWCTGDSLNMCLDDLSMVTISNVYVDKNNKIRVAPASTNSSADLTISDSNIIYTSKSDPSYSNVYSGINLKYNILSASSSTQIYNADAITLTPGENKINDITFNSSPVISISSIVLKATNGAYIKSYDYNDKYASIVIVNSSDTTIVGNLTINGLIGSEVSVSTFVATDNSIVANNIADVSLPIVCSSTYASVYAKSILNMYSDYASIVTIDSRGFPALELFDVVNIESATASINGSYNIVKMAYSFLDGLSCAITARVSYGGVNSG